MSSSKRNRDDSKKRSSKKRRLYGTPPLADAKNGFFVTCDVGLEKRAASELLNWLNDLAETTTNADERVDTEKSVTNDGDNTCSDLQSELAELKSSKSKANYFTVIDSGAQGSLFIKVNSQSTGLHPLQLHSRLLQDVTEKKIKKTRFCARFIPIIATCNADLGSLKKHAALLIEQYFTSDEEVKFSIVINKRHHTALEKSDIIDTIAGMVTKTNYKVDLKAPQVSIYVELCKNFLGLSILKDYHGSMKRGNLRALYEEFEK